MFKKSNRAKNIRRKIETSDDEDQTVETTVITQTAIKSSDKKKKKEKEQRSLGLSFDHEEEGDIETFQVKKSKASRRLASGRPLRMPDSSPAESITTEISYTSEVMESLRKNTPSMPAALKNTATALNDDDALVAEKFSSSMTTSKEDTIIPSAHAIHAAKKKREQLRKGIIQETTEDDFIALDDSKEYSRLVREEDEIGDDGEAEYEQYVGERLTLNKAAALKQEKERLEGVREMIEEAQEDDDNRSEDLERWERDLIRHGGVKPQRREEEKRDPYAPPPGYRPALVPNQTAIPTLAETIKSLSVVSNNLEMSLKGYEAQLSQIQNSALNLQTVEQDIKKEIERGSERYDYFQDLASYVNDLGEFLDAKFPELEALEKEAHDIYLERYEEVRRRRWLDDLDDLHQFALVPDEIVRGDYNEEPDGRGQLREQIDSEFVRQQRRVERQGRLSQKFQSTETEDHQAAQEQGLWTDDELSQDWSDHRKRRIEDIRTSKLQAIISDVSDDFASLEAVKDRFEPWKIKFLDDYQKAFGSLSLPGAFEFYIRCELLTWRFSSRENLNFEHMQWHKILSQYGARADGEGPDDMEVLDKVVEKVIIKKYRKMLEFMDIASTSEMSNSAYIVEQISLYVNSQERAYQDLLAAIELAIDKNLKPYMELLDKIVLKTGPLSADELLAKRRFFWRQCKYLKTLYLWRGKLPNAILKTLGNAVMNRMVAPILRPSSDPEDAKLQSEALQLLARLE